MTCYRVLVGDHLMAPIFDRAAADKAALFRGGKVLVYQLVEIEPHMHKATYATVGDTDVLTDECGDCGLDLRDPIHATRTPADLSASRECSAQFKANVERRNAK